MEMPADVLQSGERFLVDGIWKVARRVSVISNVREGRSRVVVVDQEGQEHIYREGATLITEED